MLTTGQVGYDTSTVGGMEGVSGWCELKGVKRIIGRGAVSNSEPAEGADQVTHGSSVNEAVMQCPIRGAAGKSGGREAGGVVVRA
jgi:hypothetical protein